MTQITISAPGRKPIKTDMKTIKQLNQQASGGAIKIAAVLDALPELELACQRKIDAAESFADACKAVATKAGIEASVISTYVTAKVKDTLEKQQKKVEQLNLLFEETE